MATTKSRSRRRRITPEDLTRFTYLSSPQIAPDGSSIAFIHKTIGAKNEYLTNVWMVDTEGGTPHAFTSSGKDASPRWSPDGTQLAFVSTRTKPGPQVFTIDAGGGEARQLTSFPEGSIGAVKWSPDGRHLGVMFRETDPEWTESAAKERKEKGLGDPPRVIDHWWYRLDGDGYFNGQRYGLYLVDAETGEHSCVYARDVLGFFSFDFSPDSKQVVIATNRDKRAGLREWSDELIRVRLSTGKMTVIPNVPEGPKDAVRWSPDGKTIAYAGREGAGDSTYSTENLELWVCDAAGGNARSLTGKEDYCLMSAPMSDTADVSFSPVFCWAPDSRRLYVQLGSEGESHLAWVKRSGGALQFLTRGAKVHSAGNISADGKRMAMTIGTTMKIDEIAVAALGRDSAATSMLTDLNGPLLKQLELSRPKQAWITTADGTKLHVWTMMPVGHKPRSRRKCPAVMEVHGGPHAQYGVGFFHEFQVLAAQGYAVFYSNPRGSKGYGRDHCAAIRGAWGTADWVDIQALIEHMKSQSFVNTNRMGVMGGSYGGYMTNWVIGHNRDFAGAITDRCVSNLVSMFGSSDFASAPDLYWRGNAWDRPEDLWEQSPLKYLGNAKTPTLIIHSEGDLRCNVEQAEQVYVALTVQKVPTRFVRYPRSTSHGLSRCGPPDMRIHRLGQILGWWEKYLKA